MVGLIYAMVTQAAAWIPPESEKISTHNPNMKLKKTIAVRLFLTGKSIVNKIYG